MTENEILGVSQIFIVGHPGMFPACSRASARPLRLSLACVSLPLRSPAPRRRRRGPPSLPLLAYQASVRKGGVPSASKELRSEK